MMSGIEGGKDSQKIDRCTYSKKADYVIALRVFKSTTGASRPAIELPELHSAGTSLWVHINTL